MYLAKEEGYDPMIRAGARGRTVGLLFLWFYGVKKGCSDPYHFSLVCERAVVQNPVVP